MSTICLLRHAKSRWDEPGVADHDRGLGPRGERAAVAMGRKAGEIGLAPDLILVSTARRAQATLDLFLSVLPGEAPDVRQMRELYMAQPQVLTRLIAAVPGDAGTTLMLVGHDPGMHQLALLLVGRGVDQRLDQKFPTAALAVIDYPGLPLDQAVGSRGRLRCFLRPKDLGPDL